MNNKVLIVGSDHHNTLGLIESFGLKGIKSYVILFVTRPADWVLKSKYVEKGWMLMQPNDIIKTMLQNFTDKENKAIAIAASDRVAVLLDKNYDRLSSFFILPTVKEIGTLSAWMSKTKMAELAQAVGLLTPKYFLIKNGQIPTDVTYPCITKAVSSIEGSKSDICICYTKAELVKFLSDPKHCDSIHVSTFIDKAFEFQFLGCSLGGGEVIIISGRTHIYRPNGIDNTFFLRFDKIEDDFKETENKIRAFIKQTGYSGPFSVEFLRGKNNVNYFTEMNYRNDGNAICQTAAGMNIAYIYYLYYSGGDYLNELEKSSIKTTWLMPELFYLGFLFKREISFKEWWKNMKKATCYTTYFKDDKRPFFAFLLFLLHRMFIKIKIKLFGKE